MQPPSAASSPPEYEPSLDGVRALCLLAVVAYHAGLPWAAGGYLGVSTFFTLSGFLITRLLLAEVDAQGRIAFGRFFARRIRRLLPASLLTIAALVVSASSWVSRVQLERLGADLLACLAYAINWRFVGEGYAYALLFVEPSEVQHFWSLAIEGQFYLIFPFVVAIAYRGRRSAFALAAVLSAGAALSLGWGAWLYGSAGQERVYFGTDTRIAELLVGGGLALALRRAPSAGARAARTLDAAGLAALALVAGSWIAVELDSPALYRGGLGVYALVSAALLAGCVAGGGRLRALLSPPPLRYVGRISYGAYLYHWPVLLALEALELPLAPRLGLALAATLVLAGLSHRFVEEPIRRQRAGSAGAVAGLAAAASLVVAASAVLQFPELRRQAFTAALELVVDPPPRSPDARRIVVYGDSTAIILGTAFDAWVRERPALVRPLGVTRTGCGLLSAYLLDRNRPGAVPPTQRAPSEKCAEYFSDVRRSIGRASPDVAVVLFGPWDPEGVVLPDGATHLLGEPRVDEIAREAIRDLVGVLSSQGARVLWLEAPSMQRRRSARLTSEELDRGRLRFNELLREHAAERPDVLSTVDLSAWLAALSEEHAGDLRPDGTHLSREAAIALVETRLGPRTLEVMRAEGSAASPR
jgi:peptidoglycan/LPS O-acetylase OafA/YrhL